MALLKYDEIKKMDKKTLDIKLKDLRFELTKANVTANKTNAKTKEIKRAIARILTYKRFNKTDKGELKNK